MFFDGWLIIFCFSDLFFVVLGCGLLCIFCFILYWSLKISKLLVNFFVWYFFFCCFLEVFKCILREVIMGKIWDLFFLGWGLVLKKIIFNDCVLFN